MSCLRTQANLSAPDRPLWYEKNVEGMNNRFVHFRDFLCNFLYTFLGMQSMRFAPHRPLWYEKYATGMNNKIVHLRDFMGNFL